MGEQETARFLALLWRLQSDAGLKNAELARIMGCDPSYIRHLIAGRRKRLGLPFALAAARHFPELRSLLLAEFPEGNHNDPPGNEAEGEDR